MQLRKQKALFNSIGAHIIVVFREEEEGALGASRSALKSGISPILLDSPVNVTKAYSKAGFSTYLIGKEGNVKAEISGAKGNRPTAKEILAKARQVFK